MACHLHWSAEQVADIARRREAGETFATIGAAHGVSREAIRRVVSRAPSAPPAPPIPAVLTQSPMTTRLPPLPHESMGRIAKPRGFSVERILVLPDTHRPFHDEQAWRLAMRAGKGFRPDRIIHLGDLWDMFAISDFPKSPERKGNFESEIKSGCEALDEMAALGASRLDITLGNHEYRWDKYLTKNAPEFYNFLRFEEVVRFKERGWHVTPYKKHLTVGKVHFTHEVGYCGKQAHVQSRQEFEGNCVIGHTHGLASEYKGNLLGSAHVGIQLGWLGDKEAIDYAHKRRSASWVHAIGVAYHEPNAGNVHVLPTPLVGGRCVVEGQLYEEPEVRRAA